MWRKNDKNIKFVAIRCVLSSSECTKNRFRPGVLTMTLRLPQILKSAYPPVSTSSSSRSRRLRCTLATKVAESGDKLSPERQIVARNGKKCCWKRRLDFVAVFGDYSFGNNLTFVAVFGNFVAWCGHAIRPQTWSPLWARHNPAINQILANTLQPSVLQSILQ